MARVKDDALTRLHGWPEGIDNLSRETELPIGKAGSGGKVSGRLREAENVDIDDLGKPSRRDGYEQVEALPELHSLWADKRFPFMLGVYDGNLVAWDEGENRTTVVGLISRTSPMSYDFDAGFVYFSNGFDSGRIDLDGVAQDWACELPFGVPTLSANAAGALAAGVYQVTITFIDEDGRESGSALCAEIELEAGQGILCSNIPQPLLPSITTIRLYCTECNGEVPYFVMDVPVGMDSAVIGVFTPTVGLTTQFAEPLPAGEITRLYRGYHYVARNTVLYWSNPRQYGQAQLFNNYVKFSDRITLLEGVGDGLFLAAGNRTYYMGSDPTNPSRAIAHPQGAVPGSSCQVEAKALGLDLDGDVPIWLGTDGQFVIGLPGGRVQQLHADRYAAPVKLERAATVFREADGARKLLATMKGGVVNPMGITDIAEAEVWRNGVRIS